MADDQRQLQRFSYTQNDLVQQFSIRNAIGAPGVSPLNAVADVSREEKNREAAEWRPEFDDRNLNSKIELRDLAIEKDKLEVTLKTFQKTESTLDWNFDGVTAAVHDAKSHWENKKRLLRGTPQNYFHEILGTFDKHSNLFDVLPSQNNYFSVLAGATKSLVKASANHRDTVEVLSKALKEINEEAESCAMQIKLIRSERVKKALAKFYAHIFLFYGDCIQWYKDTSARKIRHSLDQKFTEKFTKPLMVIKRLAAQVREAANFGSDAEIRHMRLNQEVAHDDVRLGLVGLARMVQETRQFLQQIQEEQRRRAEAEEKLHDPAFVVNLQAQQWKSIGISGSNQLLENARSFEDAQATTALQTNLLETRSVEAVEATPETDQNELAMEEETGTRTDQEDAAAPKKSDVQLRTARLYDYVRRGATVINVDPSIPLYLDVSMAVALEQWTLAQNSRFLYLEEQSSPQLVSGPSLAAVRIVWSSVDLKIPVISFFCEADPDDSSDEEWKRLAGPSDPLLGMVYALIHQLIGLLPPILEQDTSLTVERFESLDGSSQSWHKALELLKEGFILAPPLLSCVIDGIHAFEETSPRQIHQLMEVFRFASRTEGKTLKFLFTNQWRAKKLLPELRGNEMIIMEGSKNFGGVPGGPMPGTRLFSGK